MSVCCSYKELALLMLVVIMGMLIFRLLSIAIMMMMTILMTTIIMKIMLLQRSCLCGGEGRGWYNVWLNAHGDHHHNHHHHHPHHSPSYWQVFSQWSSSLISLKLPVPLLGDHHDDLGGLRRHLSGHLVWQVHRSGRHNFINVIISNIII